MAFEYPTAANAKYKVKDKYQNFIGGKWVDPKMVNSLIMDRQ